MSQIDQIDLHDEFFDVYYDVCETLSRRVRQEMDLHFKAGYQSAKHLAAMKTIRERIVQAVAEIRGVDSKEIFREIESVRAELSEA